MKKTKSEWRVLTNEFEGRKTYFVYRIRDMSKCDNGNNREYLGLYTVEEEAQETADKLNRKQGEKSV